MVEEGAEAALVCAALARRPGVQVLETADVPSALRCASRERPVLAIVGRRALADSVGDLVKGLGGKGVPVVGVAAGLPPAARRRALAAGVREIHARPAGWPAYSALIDSLVGRFTRTDSAPRRGRTK